MAIFNRKVVLAKTETTYGTDASPTGAANAILCRNATITPLAGETVTRELLRPFYGAADTLVASKHVKIDLEIELAGAGTAGTAPAYGPLLRACGFAQTINAGVSAVYAPVSSSFESVSLYVNIDGIQHKAVGCRGTVDIDLKASEIPTLKFSFTGLYVAPSDVVLPSVTLTAFQAPLAANKTNTTPFTIFTYAAVLESLSLSIGNDVKHRNMIGTESIIIQDRKVTGSVVIEAPAITAKDFFAIAVGKTTGALSITHGTAAGNKVTIAAPHIDIGQPSYSDNDGFLMINLPVSALPSASTGNDELTITVL